jgi:pyruvate, water dikinase
MGPTNVEIVVPFVRTLGQAHAGPYHDVRSAQQGHPNYSILKYFDGFSIGSNDLTQLTLGLDRDSGLELLAKDFDERDLAVKAMLQMAIKACLEQGKYVGICGQGPNDPPKAIASAQISLVKGLR